MKKKRKEKNLNQLKIKNVNEIRIRLGEKVENGYLAEDYLFTDSDKISLILELLNALLLNEEKELKEIKEKIKNIKIEF